MTDGAAPRLVLSAAQRTDLCAAAEAAYPNEYCALLIGVDDSPRACRVTRIVPAANVHPEPQRNFELDPRVLIAVHRALREAERAGQRTGERLLGHVHSHPDGVAQPSDRDAALAYEPTLLWLVIAVRAGKAEAVGGFCAKERSSGPPGFASIPIVVR